MNFEIKMKKKTNKIKRNEIKIVYKNSYLSMMNDQADEQQLRCVLCFQNSTHTKRKKRNESEKDINETILLDVVNV